MENNIPDYGATFNFEDNFRHEMVEEWIANYWFIISSVSTVMYLSLIFGIQALMKHR